MASASADPVSVTVIGRERSGGSSQIETTLLDSVAEAAEGGDNLVDSGGRHGTGVDAGLGLHNCQLIELPKVVDNVRPVQRRSAPRAVPPVVFECSLRCGQFGNPLWDGLCSRCLYFHSLAPALAAESAAVVDAEDDEAKELAALLSKSDDDLAMLEAGVGMAWSESCSRRGRSRENSGHSELSGVVPSFSTEASGEAPSSALPANAPNSSSDIWKFWRMTSTPMCLACVTSVEIVLFIYTLVINGGVESAEENSMIGPNWKTLYLCGALRLDKGQHWRLFSAMWLHAGILHLLSNAIIQWFIGGCLEAIWGSRMTAALYLLTGLGGNLLSATLSSPRQITVGASGAVHGLMAAALVGDRNDNIDVWPVKLSGSKGKRAARITWQVIAFALVASLVGGLVSPSIDSWAHLGGAIVGFAVAAARRVGRPDGSILQRVVHAFAAAVGLAGFALCIYLLQCSGCYHPPGQVAQVLM
eukprot:TRINITY_DN15855_c1_g1_i1.p1 TRINITY_DN15855_c1_g1~~TRINITY_DN15855_c1_g1_i1.p1  ORF type:complete len:473 (-),score=83.86 TRINITY_DN15855_c1_g1_i1:78-1496(-)